jgi:hypothetical protein
MLTYGQVFDDLPSDHRNDGYFFYDTRENLKTIRQVCAFEFDELESAGVSDGDAFVALAKVVYGQSNIDIEDIVTLDNSVTLTEPELPTYQKMRWWQEGVEIMKRYKLLGITDPDIDYDLFMADLYYGPENI